MVERGEDGALHPVVMDFGLAREAGEGKGLTESGAVMGTPAYMSPEQARGDTRHIDRSADVYSLGATLYDILTGTPPFDDETVVSILIKVVSDQVRPLRAHDPNLPEALELITSKCLNKEPEQRYPTAQALAEDLDRYLNAGRVTARRLGYGYRLNYWARHNRPLAALSVALGISILSLAGFGVYTRIVNLRKAEQSRRQAELARLLGQEIKDIEWLMRTARGLPLHDIEKEKAQVRQRMSELAHRFQGGGETTAGLVHYGVGRGHLALHEYKQAHEHLGRSESLGTTLPELHYALGRVQGELYSKAIEDARRSGDASFFEKRRKELEADYLKPALRHLAVVKNSGARVESPRYLEGLIAFYTKQPELALQHADAALAQDGWLYEANKLAGDVFFARAIDEKDRGEHDQAEKDFQEAIKKYEAAADIGRSDHGLHEAIAEAWIRGMEMDVDRGRDPKSKHEQALQAAGKAIEASSKDSYGYTKKAFSYFYMAKSHLSKNENAKGKENSEKVIEAGKQAIEIHSEDPHAHDITGIGYFQKSQADSIETAKSNIENARHFLDRAIQIDPRFPWAYNDQANTYLLEFDLDMQHGSSNVEHLRKAKEYLAKAVQIDSKYFIAYNNLAQANRLLSQWLVEHGQAPFNAVDQAVESATASLKINEKNANSFGIIGEAYLWQAIYEEMLGKDVGGSVNKSIEAFNKFSLVNSNNVLSLGDISYIYYLKVKGAANGDAEALREGLTAIEKCEKLEPKYSPCLWTKGLLLAASDWKRAAGLARQAVENALPEQAAEANFTLATIIYEQAHTKRGPVIAKDSLDEGLKAMGRALNQNRTWPRALALQGVLAWLRAQQEKDLARRAELVRLAIDGLERAFQGNSLLKRQYAGVLQEVVAAAREKAG